MSGGVGVAASDGGTGLGNTLFGADDVDDALLAGFKIEVGDAKVVAVFADGIDHVGSEGIGRLVLILGGDNVIDGGESP